MFANPNTGRTMRQRFAEGNRFHAANLGGGIGVSSGDEHTFRPEFAFADLADGNQLAP